MTNPLDPLDDPEPAAPSKRIEASDQWAIWDIETAAQSEETLRAQMPAFKAASNLKDPEKIAADIEEKKAKYISQAALSPLTGRVIAVGFKHSHDGPVVGLIHGEDEKVVLTHACEAINRLIANRIRCVGFNIHGFDLPFLRFRAMVHGIKTPLWTTYNGRSYWASHFRDLLPELVMGRDFAGYNLNAVCKALGFQGKTGDGAFFYEMYKADKQKALDYLENDLKATEALGKRMGVIE
jgi:predicted PolB exonuclease-like 3'-5' exonuclease